MRVNVKTVFFALAIMFSGLMANAQASQLGHVNSDQILGVMPEMKRISDQIEQLSKNYEDQIKQKLNTLQTKGAQYQQEAANQSQESNQARSNELEGMQKEIQDLELKARQEIGKKQQELLEPVLEKAQAAVDKVAQSKGLIYVFDLKNGGVVYAKGTDITPDVLKELGIN